MPAFSDSKKFCWFCELHKLCYFIDVQACHRICCVRLQPLISHAQQQNVLSVCCRLLWSPYVIGQTIIFLPCDFYLLSSFFFFSPNLSGRRLDVYHTSTHGVALVRIQNARLKCAARGSLKIQDAKKSPFWHHRTTLSGCIFAAEACIDNRKNIFKHRYLLHMSS